MRKDQESRHGSSLNLFRMNKKSFLIWAIIVFVVPISFITMSKYNVNFDFLSTNKTAKRLVIPYLTCDKTCYRNKYYVSPMVKESLNSQSSFISYVISDSQKALDTADSGILSPNCTGGRLSANGNACRYDLTFRHFWKETKAPWLVVAIDDTYLNMKNLYKLLDVLESMYNPYIDQIMLGQVHHDWGTYYPHGGPGLLYSRAWVDEFFRQNMSFETIHANNFRYTYDIASGLIDLNYFPNSIWIDHPWIIVVMPELVSSHALLHKNWSELGKCKSQWGSLPRLQDVSQFHISPFDKNENYLAPPNLEEAPPYVKVFRPGEHKIRFCIQYNLTNDKLIDKKTIMESIVNKTKINANDINNRINKTGSPYPF
ncbi:hypothetical protein TRFO_14127 [Tritrichomonas foetus]|uniref:Fringe-like glycosyltransferase domain-containing protein n=1 Tax=Tritrichomonas foetus TaxID=1144522 RepID=A0A1J4KVX0_9EUKA|nr:hypothetical protein TRFO_14127 [Tritrichomonas foetus]|eukprot:OHT15375.1 hypothetical protein TRFO_14127 [Tritrichomonas foetus]